jgi:hypothetical protein
MSSSSSPSLWESHFSVPYVDPSKSTTSLDNQRNTILFLVFRQQFPNCISSLVVILIEEKPFQSPILHPTGN